MRTDSVIPRGRRVVALAFLCGLLSSVSAHADIWMNVDTPANGMTLSQPFSIGGWAIDTTAATNTGIDAVIVWGYRNYGSGEPAVLVGSASFGARPDIAAAFGDKYLNAGFGLMAYDLKPGPYLLAVYAHSSITGAWSAPIGLSVTIQADPRMNVDIPAHGQYVTQPFWVSGWAVDLAARSGTGVNTVHVWAYPTNGANGGQPVFLGGAGESGNYGGWRADIGSYFGDMRFAPSGWGVFATGLPPGEYDLVAYSHSLVANDWTVAQSRHVSVDATVPAPVISPAGGVYSSQVLALITVPDGSQVFITRDGSTPTQGSELYPGAFWISGGTALRARAFKNGWLPSPVAGADYSFVVAAPVFTLAGGTYTGQISVGISTSTPGATIYWTADGSDPTPSSPVYTASIGIPVGGTRTLKAIAIRSGWLSSGVTMATYTTYYGEAGLPSADPAGGSVPIGQWVSLIAPDPFSIVRYTLDGAVPSDASPTYVAPIFISGPTTLKARSYRSGYTPSPTATWVYATKLDPPTISPASGIYASPPVVSLTSSKPGATIRYTLDGSVPTASSPQYSLPFVPEADAIVRAIATMDGWTNSDAASASYLSAAYAARPDGSPGVTAIGTVNTEGTNGINSAMTLSFSGATGPTSSSDVMLAVNGVPVPPQQLVANGASVVANGALVDGRNSIDFQAADSEGFLLAERFTVWAGSASLAITVTDTSGSPVSGASVAGALLSDGVVTVSATTNAAGQAWLVNLPSQESLEVSVASPGYRTVVRQLAANAGAAAFALDVDNNDFHQGLVGWTTSSPRVGIVDHAEASVPFVPCADCAPRYYSVQGSALLAQDGLLQTALAAASTGDQDIVVDTKNQWTPQTVTRRFVVDAAATAVSVRYRFQTAEFTYNDSYTVTVTNLRTGFPVRDSQTIASLSGLFDANRAIPWQTLTLPVSGGDPVEVALTVTNAVDNAYVSALYADIVVEDEQKISDAKLFDLIYQDDQYAAKRQLKPLSGLSVSQHNYYGGSTKIHGTLRLSGPPDDWATSISVDVLENHVVKASGQYLSADAASTLLYRPFGANGLTFGLTGLGQEMVATPVLLEIPSADLGNTVDQDHNGEMEIRFRMHTAKGADIPQVVRKTVPKMVLYRNNNRFDERDADRCLGLTPPLRDEDKWKAPEFPCGGDDWLLPTVRTWAAVVPGVEWNDFSNMHAGSFPYHKGHTAGDIGDGRFPGYAVMDAAAAETMLRFFDVYEPSRICRSAVSVSAASVQSSPCRAVEECHAGARRPAREGCRSDVAADERHAVNLD